MRLLVVALASVLLPGTKPGREALLLVVPVAPAEDYAPLAAEVQKASALNLSVGLAVCKHRVPILNTSLCDPMTEVGPTLTALIARANATGALRAQDVFVAGHSVGGAEARRFVDTQMPDAGGVVFWGTQYTGDTENLATGYLGYPSDLAKYKTPFLALTGELDKFSVDHLAPLVEQWAESPEQYLKYPAVVPGADQSTYSLPHTMGADPLPEGPQAQLLEAVGGLTAQWLDHAAGVGGTTGLEAALPTTKAIVQPFLDAMSLDKTWCEAAQRRLPGVPDGAKIEVQRVPGYKLDSCHTKYAKESDGTLTLTLCDYTTYTYHDKPPWEPQYVGAAEIACKLIGEDRIAELVGLPAPDMKSPEVQDRCSELNKAALAEAQASVAKHWPRAHDRYAAQGKAVQFLPDAQTHAGPQWLLEGLGYHEDPRAVRVQGTALITTVKSWIYPGAHYCKLLSPSKAVDIVMTMGLTKRYPATAETVLV